MTLDEYKIRAKEQMQRGDYGGAIRSLTEAMQDDKQNVTLYLTRGLAYYMRRDYDLAIEDLKNLHSEFEADFTLFFEDLRTFSNQKLKQISKQDQ